MLVYIYIYFLLIDSKHKTEIKHNVSGAMILLRSDIKLLS